MARSSGKFRSCNPRESTLLTCIQCVNFLNKMAFEVEIEAPGSLTNGEGTAKPGHEMFVAMRRKWHR